MTRPPSKILPKLFDVLTSTPTESVSGRSVPILHAMNFMNAIDTNVWVYRYDLRDPVKRQKAYQLIQGVRPLALLWQVGCEFVAACRKLAPTGFSTDDAWTALANIQSISASIELPDPRLWPIAQDLQRRY